MGHVNRARAELPHFPAGNLRPIDSTLLAVVQAETRLGGATGWRADALLATKSQAADPRGEI